MDSAFYGGCILLAGLGIFLLLFFKKPWKSGCIFNHKYLLHEHGEKFEDWCRLDSLGKKIEGSTFHKVRIYRVYRCSKCSGERAETYILGKEEATTREAITVEMAKRNLRGKNSENNKTSGNTPVDEKNNENQTVVNEKPDLSNATKDDVLVPLIPENPKP